MTAVKGSFVHKRAGRIYAIAMALVAVTTLVFMANNMTPLALVQALGTLYLLATAVLALHRDHSLSRLTEGVLLIFPIAMLLLIGRQVVLMVTGAAPLIVGPLFYLFVFGGLFIGDIRAISGRVSGVGWVRRHLLRMLLAFSFASMAILREVFSVPIAIWATVPLVVAMAIAAYFGRRVSDRVAG